MMEDEIELLLSRKIVEVETYHVTGTDIRVSTRGDDRWAITDGGSVWNGEKFEYEPLPSNRTDEFKARTRFDLRTALRLAVSDPVRKAV